MDSAGYRVRKPADEPLHNNSVLSCPQSTRLFALMPYISIQHLREGLFPRPALALSLPTYIQISTKASIYLEGKDGLCHMAATNKKKVLCE